MKKVSFAGVVTLMLFLVFALSAQTPSTSARQEKENETITGCVVKSAAAHESILKNAQHPKGVVVGTKFSGDLSADIGHEVTLAGSWGLAPKPGADSFMIGVGAAGQLTAKNAMHVFAATKIIHVGRTCDVSVTGKKAVERPPALLPARDFLIADTDDQKFTGAISVVADPRECRAVEFHFENVHIIAAREGARSSDEPGSFNIFYPGITFRFINRTCIPAKGSSPNIHFETQLKGESGAGMSLDHGQLVSSGGMSVTGKGTVIPPFEASVIEFYASPGDALVFQLTKGGYRYVSGAGTVKLLSGNVYRFPLMPGN